MHHDPAALFIFLIIGTSILVFCVALACITSPSPIPQQRLMTAEELTAETARLKAETEWRMAHAELAETCDFINKRKSS